MSYTVEMVYTYLLYYPESIKECCKDILYDADRFKDLSIPLFEVEEFVVKYYAGK